MKRYLVLMMLNDVNKEWNEDDVARWVSKDEDDLVIATREISRTRWKTVKKRVAKLTKNKAKGLWKVLGIK